MWKIRMNGFKDRDVKKDISLINYLGKQLQRKNKLNNLIFKNETSSLKVTVNTS